MSETRERFDESLDVLRALLTREEVSWDGNYYKFDPITIMPRPMNPGGPQMMMAAVNPEAIYHSAKAGYHVETAEVVGNQSLVREQIESFHRGKEECGEAGKDLTLTCFASATCTARWKSASVSRWRTPSWAASKCLWRARPCRQWHGSGVAAPATHRPAGEGAAYRHEAGNDRQAVCL